MTRQEFERGMERARLEILRNDKEGVCWALFDSFVSATEVEVDQVFTENFESDILSDGYFLSNWNNEDNMTQIERRLVFLESFKGFCNAYELWREW